MIKVAIAEDDFRVAKIHEEYIKKIKDMKVVGSAINATETLELLNKESIDLLLLDIYMPDRMGTDFLQEIRENYSGLDVIMITAATDKHFLAKSLEYGVFHYLIKPVEIEKFNHTMDQYKMKKKLFHEKNEVDQKLLESIFGKGESNHTPEKQHLPPGIDSVTLDKVINLLQPISNGITSEKVGEMMGASRTTARRYLEYLVGTGHLKTESVYGIVGRPERRYYLQKSE